MINVIHSSRFCPGSGGSWSAEALHGLEFKCCDAKQTTPRLTTAPRPLWQRVLAGERLPKRLCRHPTCEGTVEDHRPIALDVRELIRKRVFERPVGSIFYLNLAFPWLRLMRLNSCSLDLELVTGRVGSLRRHG